MLLMKCGLVGLVVGLVSRMLRAVATVNGVHYESIFSGLILLLLCVTVSATASRRQSIGVVGAFQICTATWSLYTVGWLTVHGRFWSDILVASIIGGGISLAFALMAMSRSGRKVSR